MKNSPDIDFFIEEIGSSQQALNSKALKVINSDPLLPKILKNGANDLHAKAPKQPLVQYNMT